MKSFDFRGMFIFDLANNHQGDKAHALKIIDQIGAVSRKTGVKGAFKFQFRQIETFIHPDFQDRQDVKHIPRFVSTALSKEDYRELTQAVKRAGMISICTPFDEESVDLILELGIEVIKVASCSATDWPLLERIAQVNRPVVLSTAGLTVQQIDRIVLFFESHDVNFALMHCVAIYPTPLEKLQLNQIALLKERYPHLSIGFSTHEDPENLVPVRIACAKGAELFERHVGIESKTYGLNAYSSTPAHVEAWIHAYQETLAACGGEHRSPAPIEETVSLRSLMRGVYAKTDIAAGETIARDNIFFAMPLQEGQLASGEWRQGWTADQEYAANSPLSAALATSERTTQEMIYGIMLEVRAMLKQARIYVGESSSIELSHHYGLERFREFGAVLIDCINREYCKKILVQLPRQKHPYHFHKRKEETFQLLYGDMEVEKEGRRMMLKPGDTILVEPGTWHKFHTLHGAVCEEISTTHYNDDSFYEDERIARLARHERKTALENWTEILQL